MKPLQKYLRTLIATGSVLGFMGGWALIAHAGKPAPLAAPAPIIAPLPSPTLAPLPSFDSMPSGLQPLPSLQPRTFRSRPRLRSGGS